MADSFGSRPPFTPSDAGRGQPFTRVGQDEVLLKLRDGAAVRDTEDRGLGYCTTTRQQWQAFTEAVKTGRFE